MSVVGVDGCHSGWVVATRTDVVVIDRLGPLVSDPAITVIGVDMPIGLPERWGRQADDAARRFLGRRSSTVFPTPPRSLLGEESFDAANARSRLEYGRGLPHQSFNLFPKIREIDALVRPEQGERVIEVHPECSFCAMAGGPVPPKQTAEGRDQRLRLLEPRYGDIVRSRPAGARIDDVLDAFAALWSSERFARAEHIVHGPVERDRRGLPMRIVS
jgi:predicted RNase H-like nuclease